MTDRSKRGDALMGHETFVEVDDVHWFHGYGPVEVAGECTHDCEHLGRSVIAWGPSFTFYELVQCDSCLCRAWEAALPGSKGGIEDSHPWLQVPARHRDPSLSAGE